MTKQLTISGMSCQHCVAAVRESLSSIDGCTVMEVEIGSALVDPGEASDEALAAAIAEEGFTVESIEPGV